jgi:serine O-acetyltransferase
MSALIKSIRERDPARPTFFEVLLAYNGFHAVCLHRVNQWVWRLGLRAIARFLANLTRILTGIEIHPQARIGSNLFIDHGTGVVIGQTALIGNDVTIYQGVTLGGKGGPDNGTKRHPTIMDGATIGAGAQVLGNITIGRNARIGAGSIVLSSVPDECVAVGNPARKINCDKNDVEKSYGLPHEVDDPVMSVIKELRAEIELLKKASGKKTG